VPGFIQAKDSEQFVPQVGPFIQIWDDAGDNYKPTVAYNPLHDEYLVVWVTRQDELSLDIISVTSVNDPPVLVNNTGLTVDEGGAETITSTLLLVTDTDNTPAELVYTVVVVPVNGTLKLGGTATVTFTQKDIDDGMLAYEHDGSETTSDSFVFSVSDGAGTIDATSFNISITPMHETFLPLILNN